MSKYPTEQERLNELQQRLEGLLQVVSATRLSSRTPWKSAQVSGQEAQLILKHVEEVLAECVGAPLNRCGAKSSFGYVCDLPRHEGNDHAGEAPGPGNRIKWSTW